jgi:Protein of unknown function (DUF3144)
MAYPPEFLKLVDRFIDLANQLAEGGQEGEVSAAILFAAGRYNAFNFLSNGGTDEDQEKAVDFYVSEPAGGCRARGEAARVGCHESCQS